MAENETDTLRNWERVYKSYKRFGHCDDGAIGEGYSDKIAKLLARDWQHIGILNNYVLMDKGFATFVVKHIDETAKVDDLKQIFINSTKHCPSGSDQLCISFIQQLCFLNKEASKQSKQSLLNEDQAKQFCNNIQN